MKAQQQSRASDDSGIGLVEVIVAISLIMIVATASVSLFISGLRVSSEQEQRQIAITVANDLLADVAAQSTTKNPTTGVIGVIVGRSRTAVDALWAANSVISAQTYRAWDGSGSTSVAAVPMTGSVQRSGVTFTTQVIIGSCYQRQRPTGECTVLSNYANSLTVTPPTAAPAGYSQLLRVIVTVAWGKGKTYQATTLLDPNSDVPWVTSG